MSKKKNKIKLKLYELFYKNIVSVIMKISDIILNKFIKKK